MVLVQNLHSRRLVAGEIRFFPRKMNFHLAAALVFFGPSLVQAQKCPSDFPKKIQGKCFNFPMKKASFHEASEFCKSSGGRLFEPQNNAASQKVSKMALNKFTNYWIGINDINTEGML